MQVVMGNKESFPYNCIKTYRVKLQIQLKKFTHVCIALIQGKIMLQSVKFIYYTTSQFIRSLETFVLGPCCA